MIPIIPAIKALFNPGKAKEIASDIIGGLDNLFTSKEEKLQKEIELTEKLNGHFEKMAELGVKETEVFLKDMADARDREVKIATSENAPMLNKIITPVLALLVLGSTFLFWYIIIFKDLDPRKEVLVSGIIGSLTTISMGVIGYYFGSSTGSKQKGDQIDKMINK